MWAMSKTNGATQWIHALILALLPVVFALGLVVPILIYDSCAAPDPNPSVTVHDDPRPKRAYEELGRTAARSRHDIIAAHERISALEWQLFVVIKTCPGQAKPPAPPWPVLQPKWSEPVRLPTWESFVLRHVRSEGK